MKSVCGKMGKSAVLSAMVALLAVLVALLPVTPALAAGTWTSQRTLLKESHFNDVYFLSGGTTGWAVGTPYYDNDPTPVLHHCWYTNNGGTTWTGQTVGTETDLMFASMEGVYFLDVNNGYAVGERGFICKCANAAAGTWSVVRKGTNTEFLQDVIIFDASSAMVVGVDKPDQGDQSTWSPIVLQTSDGGTNWRSVDLYDTCFADALNGWAVGDGGVIIHTTDGGSTWAAQTSTTTNGLNGISAASTTVAWAVGAGGTIISTTDGGSTWAAQTSTTTNGLNGISAASTTVAWAVGAGGTIVKTINGGTNWVAQISGVTGNLHSVSAIDANNAWGVGHDTTSSSPVVLKTDDAGAHWRNVQLNDTFFFNASNGWAVGDGGTIISTTDGGSTWAAQTSTTTENLSGVSATSATVAWAVGAGGTIVNTTDGGTTWVAQTSTTTNGLSGISAASTTVAWAVGAGGTIVKTTDGGTTWAAQTSTTTNGLNGISAASTTVAWAVGAGGTIVKTA
ncbi:MAG: hypothetical protein KJ602_06715, partial [Actinobacteria bacterium]|nr:hypothetical protein [Actinomycetota bacterium]